ncbi:YciI family protein [Clostridium thailandense]|uniref:YciI family protein n=1 Tax=Clostridium thailandense TaxID=2794346 RepID=UPI003989D110
MQFMITAYDGTDKGAYERRLAARERHLKSAEIMASEGKLLYAVAILNEEEKMIGSLMILEFASRDELDEYFKKEPYITGKVWEKIEVKPCKVPPIFTVS